MMRGLGVCFLSLILIVIGVFTFDNSKLIHQTDFFTLIDKWHEDSCSPIMDANGNYLGETCSDEWTFVLTKNGDRRTTKVSGSIFKSFMAGDKLKVNYDKGKLGFHHNESWQKVA